MERVVVAEDNPSMAMALQLLLKLWGWDVHVVSDGVAAVGAIRDVRPTVALIDLGLPKLDGLEVARQINSEETRRPLLVALSGYGEDHDLRRSLEAGFDQHLVKPVDPAVLRATLAAVRDGNDPSPQRRARHRP
jgi:DNA-binding response OmpR family regulator